MKYKLPLYQQYASWQCPYCGKGVGYIGRALAWFFGTRIHGCDFSNIVPPRERAAKLKWE
jgi:hypothetical protein